MRARIKIQLSSGAEAKRVYHAVCPDNQPLPAGLRIESHLDVDTLVFEIESTRSIDSLGATIEDLMSAIDLSLRTAQAV
jgi:hypothetical protein